MIDKKSFLFLFLFLILKNRSFICFDVNLNNFAPKEKYLNLSNLSSTNIYNNLHICITHNIILLFISCKKKLNIKENNFYIISKSYEPVILLKNNNNTILISFKGTTTFENLLTNLDISDSNIKGESKNILIHKGIYEFYLSIEKKLIKKIENILKNNDIKFIYICGHSLGSSLSIICSFILSKLYKDRDIIFYNYSFAPIKFVNKYFIDEYFSRNVNFIQLINKCDKVSKFPFLEKYHHLDKNTYSFNSNSNIPECHYPSTYYNNINNAKLNN